MTLDLRNSITSCIAKLNGSPDRDYSVFVSIVTLYHTTVRFAEYFVLDDSDIQCISDARDILFERNANAETVQTITCPQDEKSGLQYIFNPVPNCKCVKATNLL